VAYLHALKLELSDQVNGVWGLAVMQLQPNIPDTLPGQNVTFLLFGDTEIEDLTTGQGGGNVTASSSTTAPSGGGGSTIIINWGGGNGDDDDD